MMKKTAYILLVLTTLSHICDGYKILTVFPMAMPSHQILAKGVVKALLEAGHEVTQLTPFPDKNLPPNLSQVDLSAVDMSFATQRLNVTTVLNGQDAANLFEFKPFIEMTNRNVFQDSNLQKLMGDTTQTFDVVIAEWMFSDTYTALGYLFNCPFIWFSTVEPHSIIVSMIDENTNPAYVPSLMSSNVPPYDFINRVKELFMQIMTWGFQTIYFSRHYNEVYAELIVPHIIKRGKPVIPLDDIKYNASLVLGNSHVSLGLPTRLPQAYMPIGGYHIDPEVPPLPKDLQNLLDNANNGLIYFSMGSILKSKDLPDVLKKDLLETLGSLKHTVLWKFEEVLPNLPPNVHIVHWAPQQSILAHPNCILFITHGGLLSTTEAVHFGKPIIGIPVFGDQFNNVDRAVKKGFAMRVDLAYNMKDKLKAAINEFLRDKRYTEKAKELSFIYHDRPVHPSKELVHWVEHVVKTGGAPHLRSPALDVPVYQKLYLDLFALVLIVLYVLKKIAVKIFSSKKVVKKQKKN
ncbi:UDP-glycosyltransferase UGT5 isoform X2 [Amyelois transitella]|uniref:UDP-glycosyltransferase UGT5 isoform X2 n=1 Tax=Amyelois transitella TaxID=680683 RepID=UPI00298F8CA8|nr:UDP-glycosyltransferase UGT5 isoform X2 [Amyelois transitella]